jgi:hypothetical protein
LPVTETPECLHCLNHQLVPLVAFRPCRFLVAGRTLGAT